MAQDEGRAGIGGKLAEYQASLEARGTSFMDHLRASYTDKWTSPVLASAVMIRTNLVFALQDFLVSRGLANIERVSMSPVTDPLCHDVEHVPVIEFRGVPYRTTHSMIYAKMLACMNRFVPGIFIDSPNIRLENPSGDGSQRGKYLIDFSQMDIEVRRAGHIPADAYFDKPEATTAALNAERDAALDFFEDMMVAVATRLKTHCAKQLADLGMSIDIPAKPFPRFYKDEENDGGDERALERLLGKKAGTQFFWVLGLLRENYDLVYPYLSRDNTHRERKEISSRDIFNYDLCAAAKTADGRLCDAYEVLSGGLREWVYPAIVERLIDNRVIRERPVFGAEGRIENIAALDGYGPFLAAARALDESGEPLFPETFGGGLGIERCLFALLKGPAIRNIEELTFFGKNPDSAAVFLF